MFVFGGRSDESGPWYTNHEFYCNKLQILDTQTNTWNTPTTSQDLPVGRRSHSACKNDKPLFNIMCCDQWWHQKFFCGGHRGGKMRSEGAKILKFAENG